MKYNIKAQNETKQTLQSNHGSGEMASWLKVLPVFQKTYLLSLVQSGEEDHNFSPRESDVLFWPFWGSTYM